MIGDKNNLVFQFIIDYKLNHDGCSPSVKEIADAVYVSEQTVSNTLRELEKQGKLKLNIGVSRAIEVLPSFMAYYAG